MERRVEENLTHSFCSTCKRNVYWSQSDTESVSWSADELPKCFGVRLTKLKTQLRHCSTLLKIDHVILKILLQFLWVWWTFCCIWQSCQPSMSLSVVCHIYWTDTPFGFCMLTSVDKMFIRFIFAKDMQLHYIWYYKILIKTCSCYPCEHLFILVEAAAQIQRFITANKTWHVPALQTLLPSTRMPSLYISSLH